MHFFSFLFSLLQKSSAAARNTDYKWKNCDLIEFRLKIVIFIFFSFMKVCKFLSIIHIWGKKTVVLVRLHWHWRHYYYVGIRVCVCFFLRMRHSFSSTSQITPIKSLMIEFWWSVGRLDEKNFFATVIDFWWHYFRIIASVRNTSFWLCFFFFFFFKKKCFFLLLCSHLLQIYFSSV